MRRLAATLALLAASAAPAAAGDYAEREIIGFFNDGAVFAFEEYGIQDGSGFPFSTIYVIDTATDSWVPGSPFAVRIDNDDAATIDTVRAQAWTLATPTLAPLGAAEPGRILLTNPITELSGDPHYAEFLTRQYSPPVERGHVLTLTEVPFPIPAGCPDFGDVYVGFELVLDTLQDEPRVLNRDTRIPQSRGCAIGYGVSDVIAYDRANEVVGIVLLNVFKVGFEGPDRRFLAIATPLPQ